MSAESQIIKEKSSSEIVVSTFFITKRVAMAGIFIAIGLVLSYMNPFAYFEIFGTKINPFAHIVNAMMGVLIGFTFASITALGIATLRYSLAIGSIHAFHGGISGAVVVGIVAYILWKKAPKYVELAAFFEPLGTVFIGVSSNSDDKYEKHNFSGTREDIKKQSAQAALDFLRRDLIDQE